MRARSCFQPSVDPVGFGAPRSGKARCCGGPAALSKYKDHPSLAGFPSPSIFPFHPLAVSFAPSAVRRLPDRPTIVDRPASTVHEAFRQTAFVSILGPPPILLSSPLRVLILLTCPVGSKA